LQRDDAGQPVAILETNNDITERKRAEESVRRSEKELRDLIEAIPVIAFTIWPDGSNIWINRRWVEYSGLSEEISERVGKLRFTRTTSTNMRPNGDTRWPAASRSRTRRAIVVARGNIAGFWLDLCQCAMRRGRL
jgi:PAS domain-containing protein